MTGKMCTCICAISELAWRRAWRAAIPCEITASYADQVYGSDKQAEWLEINAYPKEHPTPYEYHLAYRVRLVCESTIFSFEVFEGDRDILSGVFKSSHHRELGHCRIFWEILAIYGPWLSQIAQICKLTRMMRMFLLAAKRCGLQDYPEYIAPNLISQWHDSPLDERWDYQAYNLRERYEDLFCVRLEDDPGTKQWVHRSMECFRWAFRSQCQQH